MMLVIRVKEWQVTLGGAVVMLAAGGVLFLWANSIEVPTLFFEVNNFVLVSNQYFTTFLTGVLFIWFGGGFLICTLLIYQLEKQLEAKQPNEIIEATSIS
jgi:H+/Cl- antiporter ClcA